MSRETFERSIKKNYVGFEKIRLKDKDLVLDLLSYIDSKTAKKNTKQYIEKALNVILSEQEKGKDLKKVIGKNYKEFANGLIGVKEGNAKIDFMDLLVLTLAMIPFFVSINCLMGIKTLNLTKLGHLSYNLDLAPIMATLLIMPMIYMFFFHLAHNKKGYDKTNFSIYIIGEIIWIIILNLVQAYFKNLVIISVSGYTFLAAGSIIIIFFYFIRINGFIKGRLSQQ